MARKGLRYEDESIDNMDETPPMESPEEGDIVGDIIERVMPDIRAIIETAVAEALGAAGTKPTQDMPLEA